MIIYFCGCLQTLLVGCNWTPSIGGLKNRKLKHLTQNDELKNCLFMYDRHLSPIWYETLELARAQKVTFIKLKHLTYHCSNALKITGEISFSEG